MRKAHGILAVIFAAACFAQVPADIAAKLVDMGRNVCPADTAALYRKFQPTAPYPRKKAAVTGRF
jgi:hypothetical protein